jgi:hypothetical protein
MITATAQANPNIAFIKYWGNYDNTLRILKNGSISINIPALLLCVTAGFQLLLAAQISPVKTITFTKYFVTPSTPMTLLDGRCIKFLQNASRKGRFTEVEVACKVTVTFIERSLYIGEVGYR